MELQLADIRDNRTINSIRQLKESIFDCAKNIKSNDATFGISTLPTVSDKIIELMGSYVETVQRIESCQRAFNKLYEKISEQEENDTNKELVDLETYKNLFVQTVEEECSGSMTEEVQAQLELEKIIRPYEDEEIQVQAPARQIPKDPITKQPIRIAVKSTVCNHIYDREVIEDYFHQKERAKKRVQCPQAGCTNRFMERSELVLDDETNKLIQSL